MHQVVRECVATAPIIVCAVIAAFGGGAVVMDIERYHARDSNRDKERRCLGGILIVISAAITAGCVCGRISELIM
jgi:hypothetical protein